MLQIVTGNERQRAQFQNRRSRDLIFFAISQHTARNAFTLFGVACIHDPPNYLPHPDYTMTAAALAQSLAIIIRGSREVGG